ncbi:spermidine synthase [Flavobacterium sp. UMI-01]|uniref:spermidine synthase n=1 Tax=Flavobacterium sp. UMI-01 TaxID=1441053 RepID=UPI001C7E0323|nr:spermidine synthase [Flavobacterium sp. UMI-01]GIZ08305.1 spermidine synthase [Flavobacterium sp. UMI-01]
MLKKILSYLFPITVHSEKSTVSKSIDVNWENGALVMDSKNTNYSYGNLQEFLKLGLKEIGFEKIKNMEHILVLGVAGASVVKTIINDIDYKGRITGVEIDANIITVANKYFNIHKIHQLEIVIDDAFEFVLKTKDQYDLIIIDLFQDTRIPSFVYENYFRDRVCFLLKNKGAILFNTILLDSKQNQLNETYITSFYKENFTIRTIPRVEKHNELILIERVD